MALQSTGHTHSDTHAYAHAHTGCTHAPACPCLFPGPASWHFAAQNPRCFLCCCSFSSCSFPALCASRKTPSALMSTTAVIPRMETCCSLLSCPSVYTPYPSSPSSMKTASISEGKHPLSLFLFFPSEVPVVTCQVPAGGEINALGVPAWAMPSLLLRGVVTSAGVS